MDILSPEAAIRAQVHADMLLAWADLLKIYDDKPQIAPDYTALPRAFVELQDIPFERAPLGTAAFGQVYGLLTYVITRQASWPASGTIEQEKINQAQALVTLLTAANVYAGQFRRDIGSIQFRDGQTDAQEPILEISIEFRVQITPNA